ncbi:SOS response-associated peptidase [Pseudonocardia bannensis]|uniref:Abasic site processing protein n=1 Tax=Pseudonocardia bannensis TaxID=630973 RepID=A0A848DQC9_9PSEU|nr:SOS response-associated peptidase [Pseudonocardia bannensis]NMH94719.1 SOS response-associated peptidase [Pseudonocardia bannensis]
MCGRYASTKAPADLAEEFRAVDATETGGSATPDYNVAPTKQVFTVVQRHPRDADGTPDPEVTERSIRIMRWGLVPSWAKDPSGGARMINARSETAAEKPAFRKALAARRCLLPADGWYEWQRRGAAAKTKQPYYTHYRDGSSVALAGVWEFWRPRNAAADPEGKYADGLITAAVLTTDAVGPLAEVHDRMPLVLPPEAWDAWLDPDSDAATESVSALLAPPSPELIERLELRPVSDRVNSVRNNGPELLAPLAAGEVKEPLQLDLLT